MLLIVFLIAISTPDDKGLSPKPIVLIENNHAIVFSGNPGDIVEDYLFLFVDSNNASLEEIRVTGYFRNKSTHPLAVFDDTCVVSPMPTDNDLNIYFSYIEILPENKTIYYEREKIEHMSSVNSWHINETNSLHFPINESCYMKIIFVFEMPEGNYTEDCKFYYNGELTTGRYV